VAAYQTVISAVPGDTTFPAFMAIQAYQLAVLRDCLYDRAKRAGSGLFDIMDRLSRRGTAGIYPPTTSLGLASNIVPTDDRGRMPSSNYVQVLTQLVGSGQEKGLWYQQNSSA
jgi:hypothetical protein